MRNFVWAASARVIARIIVVIFCSGIAGAALIRFAPGFFADGRSLDHRFSPETLAALDEERPGAGNPVEFYFAYLGRLVRGDAGQSVVYGQAVTSLVRRRAPITAGTVTWGLLIGWATGLVGGAVAALSRWRTPAVAFTLASASLLCVPAAVLAVLAVLWGVDPSFVIAAIIFPRVYAHVRSEIGAARNAGHVIAARARGVPAFRTFVFHIAPAAMWPILALAGITVTIAIGASIPVEALADSPGVGQLAWNAALGRDLPVLVFITLILAAATTLSNGLAEITAAYVRGRQPR